MMGNSMYDYIEKMDKEDLEKALTPPLTPNLQFNVSPVSFEHFLMFIYNLIHKTLSE